MKYSSVIKSVSDNQHEILYNIMQLHNGGKPFDADSTYSIGAFYGEHKANGKVITIPQPKYKFDVCPQTEDTVKIEPLGKLPLEDCSIESLVIDLPFVISVGPSMKEDNPKNNKISRRFSAYYPRYAMFESYEHWIKEAYRVLKPMGILVFKSQPVVSGGIQLHTTHYSCNVAENVGFYILDEFILTAKARLISGKVNNQQHARKFHSYFHVFQKDNPKKDKIGYEIREWKNKGENV